MSTAVDSNILVDLLAGERDSARRAAHALGALHQRGRLVICAAVYAELLACPAATADDVSAILGSSRILVDWHLSQSMWRLAGEAYAAYADRRRCSHGGHPRRLLVDFLIGAHAQGVGSLLTRDLGIYRASFPHLAVIAPEDLAPS